MQGFIFGMIIYQAIFQRTLMWKFDKIKILTGTRILFFFSFGNFWRHRINNKKNININTNTVIDKKSLSIEISAPWQQHLYHHHQQPANQPTLTTKTSTTTTTLPPSKKQHQGLHHMRRGKIFVFYLLNLPPGCRRRCGAGGNGIAAQSQPPSLLVLCPVSAAHRIHARGINSRFLLRSLLLLQHCPTRGLSSDVSYFLFPTANLRKIS